jgi:iron complex outermembrane receptor protein
MYAEDGTKDHTNKGLTAQIDLDLGPVTLTYLGSSRHDDFDARSGSNNPALALLHTHHTSDEEQNSHELRVAYDSDFLKLVAGLYRFKESDDVTFGAFNVPLYGTIHFLQPDVRVKSRAAFGQATVEPVRGTRLTGGLRYTVDDKGRTGGTYLFLAETPPGSDHLTCFGSDDLSPCQVFPNDAQHRWKNTSFKLGIDHDVTDDVMAYASLTTGYKAGGYNDGPAPFDSPYDPERVTAWEAGVKSRFADDRVQANLSLFLYDYKDLQVSGIASVFGQPSLVTVNAAKARNYGAELEFTALPSDRDRIDGSLAWLHARFTDFLLPCGDQFSPPATVPSPGCPAGSPSPADYDGNRLAKAPDWTFSIGYERRFDLSSALTLTPRVQTHFESAKNLDYHNFPVSRQGSFWKADAMLTLAPANGRWSLMAYVHNIGDKAYLVRAVPISSPIPDRNSADGVWGDPRRYGLQLNFRFD